MVIRRWLKGEPCMPTMWLMIILLAILTSHNALADSLTAKVDRDVVGEQETIQFTLTHDPQISTGTPDFSGLRKDFDIVQGPSRMSNSRWINGRSSSSTEWNLMLLPKRTGNLTIPALTINGQTSKPLAIKVKPMSDAVREQASRNAFFDIQVQPQPAYYVQGQILYTEKLYFKVNHRDASLSDLAVEDARVEQMGDAKQYTSVIDGDRVGVYERTYTVQPEKAGELVIPGQRFQATAIVQDPSYPYTSRRQMISANTKPITLNILPIPAQYPAAPWLPAEQLTLKEHFSADPADWKVGDPITRTLIVDTKGMSASQIVLPDLPQPAGLKQYPDQPEHQDIPSSTGVSGQFQQSIAMVPTREGKLVLPEIRIPWWNTRKNQLEYATLPEKTLTISANPVHQAIPLPAGPKQHPQAAVPASQSDLQHAGGLSLDTHQQTEWLGLPMNWWAIAGWALAILGWLAVILMTLKQSAKRRHAAPSNDETPTSNQWQALQAACKTSDTLAIRNALQQWVMAEQPLGARNTEALTQQSETLKGLLQQLDASLFSDRAELMRFDGKTLLNELKALRKAATATSHARMANQSMTPDQPLYPN